MRYVQVALWRHPINGRASAKPSGVVFVVLSFFIKHWAHGANGPGHAQPEPIAPVLDGERQAVNPAAVRADRES